MEKTVESMISEQKLVSVPIGATVSDAIGKMAEFKIGTIVVEEKGKLRGVFSEGDLISRVLAKNLDPSSTPVAEIMTRKVKTVRRRHDAFHCLTMMNQYHCHSLPVIEWLNTAVGVVSITDVLSSLLFVLENRRNSFERFIESGGSSAGLESYPKTNMLREHVDSQKFVYLSPNDRVSEAIQIMQSAKMRCIVILDEKKLVGVLTERDILGALAAGKLHLPETRIGSVMTHQVASVDVNSNTEQCLNYMKFTHSRYVPIKDETAVVGVVSIITCMQWMCDEFEYYVRSLSNWAQSGSPI